MTRDPLNELFKDIKDPDNRAKMFLLFAGAMIMSTILIVVGTIIFILRLLHIF
ncbi:hypothetical protein [Methanobacterium sp. SMA-27]|jgi:hypothetical protein|uniref:hypothetical protein n=1 Tax=Methanobacterium sp. SMA-27 TaxID=1495336 RepID=UPI000A8C0935|nr:hypothetical protein [Methanobacterium sp. SMA-27]